MTHSKREGQLEIPKTLIYTDIFIENMITPFKIEIQGNPFSLVLCSNKKLDKKIKQKQYINSLSSIILPYPNCPNVMMKYYKSISLKQKLKNIILNKEKIQILKKIFQIWKETKYKNLVFHENNIIFVTNKFTNKQTIKIYDLEVISDKEYIIQKFKNLLKKVIQTNIKLQHQSSMHNIYIQNLSKKLLTKTVKIEEQLSNFLSKIFEFLQQRKSTFQEDLITIKKDQKYTNNNQIQVPCYNKRVKQQQQQIAIHQIIDAPTSKSRKQDKSNQQKQNKDFQYKYEEYLKLHQNQNSIRQSQIEYKINYQELSFSNNDLVQFFWMANYIIDEQKNKVNKNSRWSNNSILFIHKIIQFINKSNIRQQYFSNQEQNLLFATTANLKNTLKQINKSWKDLSTEEIKNELNNFKSIILSQQFKKFISKIISKTN